MNYNDLIFLLRKHARKLCYKAAFKKEIVNGPVDLMFEAAEAIESLTKADSWTLVEDELPPNEQKVLLYIKTVHKPVHEPEVTSSRIAIGMYSDGKLYGSKGIRSYARIDDLEAEEERNDIVSREWREVSGEYMLFGVICHEVEKIEGDVIAWMPLPEMPSIEEMRQK